MALHEQLWPNLKEAVGGAAKPPMPQLDSATGSRNYYRLGKARALLAGWRGGPGWSPQLIAQQRQDWLSDLRAEREQGHMSKRGGKGVANEQGCPSPHSKFHYLAVMGVWREAMKRGDSEVAAECEYWVGAELYLAAQMAYDGVTLEPGGRVKDEKGQALAEDRDALLALLLQAKLQRPMGGKWWRNDDGLAPSIFAGILNSQPGLRERLLKAPEPKLALPVHVVDLPGSGYLAWIEDTDEARTQLGHDALSWVSNGPEGQVLGYDWKPLPDRPEGAQERIYGAG